MAELLRTTSFDPPSRAAGAAGDGPALLGREADLATVDRALDEMLGQVVGRLIVIEGPAGAGATSLLDAICARAAARSVPVARAAGDERSRTVPFAVAVGLFAGHLQAAGPGRRGALLADRAALATPLFGPDGWSPPDDHDGGGLVEGLYWLAGQIARSDPGRRAPGLLIAVDDAHWCDHATLRLLARLTLRIEQLPLVVAIAAREGAPSDDDLLERLRGHPRAEILRPAPHDAPAIATLVGARLGRAGDPELVRACLQATGGNPFLVEEFLAALAVDGVPRGAVGALAAGGGAVAGASERAVAIRLEAVGAAGRRLAQAAAVLGDGARLRHAATLAELPIEAAEAAADALAEAELLLPGEPLRFRHGLVRAAVEAQVPAAARARDHRRAATLLAAEGAAPARVASFLLHAPPAGDEAAVATLRRAAAEAREQDELGVAVRFLRRALAEPPGAAEHRAVLVELATAEAEAGALDGIARLEQAIALSAPARDRAQLLLALARLLATRGDHAAAAAAVDRGRRTLADELPGLRRDPVAEALLSTGLDAAAAHRPLWGRRRSDADDACRGVAAAGPPDDPVLAAQIALELALRGQPPAIVVATARRAVAASPLVDVRRGERFGDVAEALLQLDQVDLAGQLCDEAIVAARARGDQPAFAVASHWRAVVHHRRGDLPAAIADAEGALDLQADDGPVVGLSVALLARLRLERGEVGAAAGLLERVAGSRPEDPGHGAALLARAAVADARGDDDGAIVALLAAGRHLTERHGLRHPTLTPWLSWAAIVAARAERLPEARRWAAEGVALARATDLPGPLGLALRAQAATLFGAARSAQLRTAVALLARSPARLERVRAEADLGAALRRAGDRTGAVAVLAATLAEADRCGATVLAARTREELVAAGARPGAPGGRGTSALTPAERRVAERAAAGQTNLQIAQDLFVATKTVEGHLRNAYRKLGVDSRRALAPILAEASGGTRGAGARASRT